MHTTLAVENFSIAGGLERLRLELAFKGRHQLEPRQYQGTGITFMGKDKSQVTLTGKVLVVPWPDAEVEVNIWPDRCALPERLTTLLQMFLPGIDFRTMITISMDEKSA